MRFETGAFNQHIHGGRVDFAVAPAHDSGQGERLGFVGNEQGLIVEGVFLAVEGDEFLARSGPLDDNGGQGAGPGGEEPEIKGVEGLAGFEHDEIGDVPRRC